MPKLSFKTNCLQTNSKSLLVRCRSFITFEYTTSLNEGKVVTGNFGLNCGLSEKQRKGNLTPVCDASLGCALSMKKLPSKSNIKTQLYERILKTRFFKGLGRHQVGRHRDASDSYFLATATCFFERWNCAIKLNLFNIRTTELTHSL